MFLSTPANCEQDLTILEDTGRNPTMYVEEIFQIMGKPTDEPEPHFLHVVWKGQKWKVDVVEGFGGVVGTSKLLLLQQSKQGYD